MLWLEMKQELFGWKKPRLLGTKTPVYSKVFQKKKFLKIAASEFLRWRIIISGKVHPTLLNVLVFIFFISAICKIHFVPFLNSVFDYSYARSLFALTFWK